MGYRGVMVRPWRGGRGWVLRLRIHGRRCDRDRRWTARNEAINSKVPEPCLRLASQASIATRTRTPKLDAPSRLATCSAMRLTARRSNRLGSRYRSAAPSRARSRKSAPSRGLQMGPVHAWIGLVGLGLGLGLGLGVGSEDCRWGRTRPGKGRWGWGWG